MPAAAVQQVSVSVGNLEGGGLRAEGLSLSLDLAGDGSPVLVFGAARLLLAQADQAPASVRVECPEFHWDRQQIRCRGGRAGADHPWLDRRDARVDWTWQTAGQQLNLTLSDLGLAGGRVRLQLQANAGSQQIRVHAGKLDLGRLAGLLQRTGLAVPVLSGSGELSLTATLDPAGLQAAQWQVDFNQAAFTDDATGYLGEGLSGNLRGTWKRTGVDQADAGVTLTLSGGGLLTPFLYLEPGDSAVTLEADLAWNRATGQLDLRRFAYRHPGVLTLGGKGALATRPVALHSLDLRTDYMDAGSLYQAYFQPLLSTTLLESVSWRGGLRLSVQQAPGGPLQLLAELLELGLEDAPDPDRHPGLAPRFALYGLRGQLRWSDRGEPQPSRLAWNGGHLLGSLEIGAADLQATLQGHRFRLTKDMEVPLLDGSLWVDRLELDAAQGGVPEVEFDAVLTPVSLGRLSAAFGWPPLSGALSGVIPGLALRKGELRVDGKLLVRAFDGDVVIEGLRLIDLFGVWPEMLADVQIKGLDLKRLTDTFSFGKITGRLDGRIKGLRLEAWRPVAFDARFSTPADDASEHAISQRAVENISNLGGAGIGGSLSRTFLGIFKEFGYERLGIGCVLADGVCRMSGLSPAEQGYFLVTGRGVPQITIKGYNRETDWNRLVQQLQQISSGGAPVVK